MKSKRQISCSLCAAKAINLRMCVTEKEAKKKRQRGRRTAGVFRRGSNHSPQLLSTLLPPPLQHCSALASRRVRSNLSLAFCCCCCCGYTGCLSLSPSLLSFPSFSPFHFALAPPSYELHLFFSASFFCSFCCLANYASRAFLCSILSCAGTHPHKVSHIVRAYQKLIYPHTLPGMCHVAAASAFVMKSKLTNFLERQQKEQQQQQ